MRDLRINGRRADLADLFLLASGPSKSDEALARRNAGLPYDEDRIPGWRDLPVWSPRSDALSRAASIVWNAHRELAEALVDPMGSGSDCDALISRASDRDTCAALAALGFTPGLLERSVRRRTTARFAYALGAHAFQKEDA